MTTQERSHFWQKQIATWQASDVSGQAFCKQQNLSYHQFVYWRRKQDKARSSQTSSATGFAKVTQATPTKDELTLTLPSGLSITGIHTGNVELLGAILRQL
ncbi:IS66 family insertion sequence element accessory protein TnpA [Microbulbifer rhizosphaerae]|uniref:Catechol-2,3-dioxygenase n=1 Tax=Microbulbifer rhizosphaerae TaxID=1562603 RepID=A0A7W4Z9B2_9GAMM|nr:IS66 family insertion sequence element accessory protein TnpB [Microbulbifer rhizosphaerae]MBB3061482.1 catechol-2,3-dioxygenase [Microbulbifer rhizosphaerae]